MEHIIKQLSNHSALYRGFVITKRPRKKAVQPVTRYQVIQGENCFGQFDAQAQATSFIDELFQERAAFAGSDGICKI